MSSTHDHKAMNMAALPLANTPLNRAALSAAPLAYQPLSGPAECALPLATAQRQFRPSGQRRQHVVPRR